MHTMKKDRAEWSGGIGFFLVLVQLLPLLFICNGSGLAASTVLGWNASTAPGLAGYKVYYQANSSALPFSGTGAAEGSAPIDCGNVTRATISGLDPNNTYYFAVTAYDSTGVESGYSNIVKVPESAAPIITVVASSSTGPVTGTVTISASASDNVGVTMVQFFVNGVLMAETAAPPYRFSWNTSALAAGSYQISAKAFDAAGNVGYSSIVTLTAAGDTTPPTVSLASPADGSIASGTVALSASAKDNVELTRLDLLVYGVPVLTGNQSPVSYDWDTLSEPDGRHTLSAVAYDAAGNVGSSAVTVHVMNAGHVSASRSTTVPIDDIRPIIKSLALASGSSSVTIKVAASDNVGVTKMELYADGALRLETTADNFTYVWTAGLKESQNITVKIYDAAGNVRSQSFNVAKSDGAESGHPPTCPPP